LLLLGGGETMTMKTTNRLSAPRPALFGSLAVFLLAALTASAQEYVEQKDPRFPRIRYADGQLSLNDRCAVRLGKLNTKIAPLYVNSRPVGFC
jgi:hypothetical protein